MPIFSSDNFLLSHADTRCLEDLRVSVIEPFSNPSTPCGLRIVSSGASSRHDSVVFFVEPDGTRPSGIRHHDSDSVVFVVEADGSRPNADSGDIDAHECDASTESRV